MRIADQQWLIQRGVGATSFATLPMPLSGNDRVTGVLLIDEITGGTTSSDRYIDYQLEVSNDGTRWVQAATSESYNDTADSPAQDVLEVHGVYVRFRFTFHVDDGALATVLFSLDVVIDKK